MATMLVHSVYFWLKPELTPAQRAGFAEALESLRAIPMAALYVGRPAPLAPRPVVDTSYDYAITCLFSDAAAHDAYQVHPVHQAFVALGKPLWARVQIYDAQ